MADPLKVLNQVLGDGARTADFEAFLKLADTMREQYAGYTDPGALMVARFMVLFSVAAVEGGREASDQNPDMPTAQIIHALCLGASISLCGAVLSVVREPLTSTQLRAIVEGSFQLGIEATINSNGLERR